MHFRCFFFLGLLGLCSGLRTRGVTARGHGPRCTVTFASHSGFGNQVIAVTKGLWIAESIGCTLLVPPVLEHFDIGYGPHEWCQLGLKKERQIIAQASIAYKRRANLSFGQIFKLNPNTSLLRYLDREIANATFLPHHCQLWEWMHFQRNDYADYMHTYMRSEGPSSGGHFTIGSAYNAGLPAAAFDRAFIGLTDDLQRAASTVQGLIALKSGRPKGRYACVHVRTADRHREVSSATVAWLRGSLDDRLPLYMMSSNSSEELLQAIGPERCATAGCFASQDLLPGGCRGDDYRRLFVELAVCAMAESVHLSTRAETIIRGKPVRPGGTRANKNPATLWGSTLQWVMSMMAQLPSIQQLRASQEEHLERSGPAVVTESEVGQLMDYLGVNMSDADADPLGNVTKDGLEQGGTALDTFCESKEHQEGAEELYVEDLF